MYKGTDITLQARGMDRGQTLQRNVQGTDIICERNVQGRTLQVGGRYQGKTLHVEECTGDKLVFVQVKGMYRGCTCIWGCNGDGHYK